MFLLIIISCLIFPLTGTHSIEGAAGYSMYISHTIHDVNSCFIFLSAGTLSIEGTTGHSMYHMTLEDADTLPFMLSTASATTSALNLAKPLDFEDTPIYYIVVKGLSVLSGEATFQKFVLNVST